ncbi:MAG: cytochrome C biogenesis protein, partial [Chloroflexi bacterium]|nr:cytochrome C biogenesis protein [Chloroflexota bacterium]
MSVVSAGRRVPIRLAPVAIAVVAMTVFVGLFVAPTDRDQGAVQRIMYVHVPSAWL